MDFDLVGTRKRIAAHLVDREDELDLALAAIAAGRDLVLEGPPGTSKTTMLKAVATEWGIPLVFVEGNADLTPSRLVGHHDPARVLREDYRADNFVEGPLVQAMRQGGFLYFEEFNRAPDDTLNVLLGAMADRQTTIPRVGVIVAAPTFRVVASMNQFDNVGTTRLSSSIKDRMCRIRLDYQGEIAERAIVVLRTQESAPSEGALTTQLVADAVAVTRATRVHPDIRQGSSVRGAIDCVLVAKQLTKLRAIATLNDVRYPGLVLDAMKVALSGRLYLEEVSDATEEEVLERIWQAHFATATATATATAATASAPDSEGVDIDLSFRRAKEESTRGRHYLEPLARKPKQLEDEPNLFVIVPDGQGGPAARGGMRSRRQPRAGSNGSASGEDDEPGQIAGIPNGDERLDPQALAIAREIAAQLAVPKPRRGSLVRRGSGDLASVPYRGGSDEIDLERTLDVLAERPAPAAEDIIVRERLRARRSVVLLIDVSGSMRGDRVRTAAAAVGALAGELSDDDLAVYGFWSDAAKIHSFGYRIAALTLLDLLLRIPAKGLTNLAFPLDLAARDLAVVPRAGARALMLSDCMHNAGPDPREVAARLPRLDILLDVAGMHDLALGRDLARQGRGSVRAVRDHRDVARGLREIFAD
jgi:MoxR-like ATPase